MEYYQQRFQTCSYLSIEEPDVKDLQSCLTIGHVFYEKTPEELAMEAEYASQESLGEQAVEETPANVPIMGLNANKAGMTGVNVDQINKQIMQISEGSKFHEHKKKQQQKIDKKVEEMKRKLSNFTGDQIQNAQLEVDKLVRTIEADVDLSHYYVHLDMDAFFASVEMRDDPSLRDVPMAVGSDSMLSTSNYVARTYGVRAAMPGFIARKLCPELRIVPCNFEKYREASRVVEETIKMYDSNLFMCMDEADLDITDLVIATVGNGPTPEDKRQRDNCAYNIVKEMREKICALTQLTASAGIAPTRFLAKLCSDLRKPNGQLMLANRKPAIMAFLSMIPVRKVCGIGAVTEQLLKGLNIETCKSLWQNRAIISMLFKRASFQNLLGISIGTGSYVFRDLSSDSGGDRKSLSCERTFIGTADLGFLENLCKSLCSEIERDLKTAGLLAKTITLKIKTTEYDVKTRARSIMERTDSAVRIFQAAWRIYLSYATQIPDLAIRLMGVRVSNFQEKSLRDKDLDKGPPFQKLIQEYMSQPTTNETVDNARYVKYPEQPAIGKFVMTCPVCNTDLYGNATMQPDEIMDFHIDDCLSRNKVREVRAQLDTTPFATPKKRVATTTAANEAKKLKRAGIQKIDGFLRKIP